MDFKFSDHMSDVLRALDDNSDAALEAIGQAAEGYAKANLTKFPRVDTGRLRSSVSHAVQKDTVYIGTDVEYAPYVEFGTGPFAEDSNGGSAGGRTDVPWFYKDENGVGHLSYGMRPSHFLRNAAKDHVEEYKKIVDRVMRGK